MALRPVSRLLAAALVSTTLLTVSSTASAAGPAKITGLDPGYVLPIGNDLVTMHGDHLDAVTGVTVDGVPVDFSDEGDGTLTFFTPQHAPGTAQVRLVTAGGISADNGTADDLLYAMGEGPLAPVTVTPSTGPVSGGTVVTITGSNLSSTLGVVFGDTELGTNLQIVSDRELRVTSPRALAPGKVDVVVLSPAGAAPNGPGDDFTYTPDPVLVPKPVISSVAPNWGVAGYGGVTLITGKNVQDATQVTFGTKPAVKFWTNRTAILAIAPPQPKGTVRVRVTGPGGTSADGSAAFYRYLGR